MGNFYIDLQAGRECLMAYTVVIYFRNRNNDAVISFNTVPTSMFMSHLVGCFYTDTRHICIGSFKAYIVT